MTDAHRQANRAIARVTWTAMAVNASLAVLKLVTGLWSGSVALLADAANSISDNVVDAAILAGVRWAGRPIDHDHHYGHGRYEAIVALLVGLVVMGVGAGFGWKAYRSIVDGPAETAGGVMMAVAAITMVSKEWLFRRTRAVSHRFHSHALNANAWNHRSDALAALVVLGGGAGISLGWRYADPVAAALVSLFILYAGIRVLRSCVEELSDAAVDPGICRRVEQIIHAHPQVRAHHELRSRRVGRDIYVDVHVLVDPALDVLGSHQITKDLKNAVSEQVSGFIDLLVHVEPDVPEQRTGAEYVPPDRGGSGSYFSSAE